MSGRCLVAWAACKLVAIAARGDEDARAQMAGAGECGCREVVARLPAPLATTEGELDENGEYAVPTHGPALPPLGPRVGVLHEQRSECLPCTPTRVGSVCRPPVSASTTAASPAARVPAVWCWQVRLSGEVDAELPAACSEQLRLLLMAGPSALLQPFACRPLALTDTPLEHESDGMVRGSGAVVTAARVTVGLGATAPTATAA